MRMMRLAIPRGREREPLLDLWRGLALVDMAWVHFARYPIGMPPALASWIGDYTRFAAGAFVLLSGMTIARVFGPRLAAGPEEAKRATVRLLRRALLLLFIDRLASVGFAYVERARLVPPGVTVHPPDLWSVATFGDGGATGGLLLLYAFLVAAVPLLHGIRRRAGDVALLAGSFAAYALASASGSSAHWPPWSFPLAFWQPFFVAGYVIGMRIDRLRALAPALRNAAIAGVSLAYAAMFLVRNGAALGIDPARLPAWNFEKFPLHLAELVWYLVASAFVMTWSAVAYERDARVRRGSEWLCQLGRKSLLVYVAHLFFELPVLEFLTLTDPSPAVRAAMLPAVALAMTAVAAGAERFQAWRPRLRANPFALLHRALPSSGTIGVGVAAATLGAVLALQALFAPPAERGRSVGAEPAAGGPGVAAEVPAALDRLRETEIDEDAVGDAGDEPPPLGAGEEAGEADRHRVASAPPDGVVP
ncbi:MAG: hypothetical protein QOD06_2116 [Candidatus Binatota bacterium]|jgi:hypothetical protein|nr:hypothetical protein [Candidatus Binatota bacterium]